MIKVSVIIPFYQSQPGILRRALQSILDQSLPAACEVKVVVTDDGSPVSATSEAEGLEFSSPFSLQIIAQANGGVGQARNTGLSSLDESTTYIAFLDSDDCWRPGHLKQGIEALESGYDFYFCDNKRDGFHDSHFACSSALIKGYIPSSVTTGLVNINKEQLSSVILKEFPSQLSTVIYRRSIAPQLRFDVTFKTAGEDIIYVLNIVNQAKRVCFSPDIMVECGRGMNIYFGNLNWDSPGHLQQVIERYKANAKIQRAVNLSAEDKQWNSQFISHQRKLVVFHGLRHFIKSRCHWPQELKTLAKEDNSFWGWFLLDAVRVALGWITGNYKPS